MSGPASRRGFLRGLTTLPLIGGGVTLIGRPAKAVPLFQAVAAPNLLEDPRQRARYAWEAFAAAMRDVTASAHGWHVCGGEQVRAVGYMPAHPAWCRPAAVYLEPMEPRRIYKDGLVDRHEEIDL